MITNFTKIKINENNYIGEITLNSPESLNIIEQKTFYEINQALTAFEKNNDIKIVLINADCGLTKNGKKVFSAGVNLKKYQEKFELLNTDPNKFRENLKKSRKLIKQIELFPKPVIIAIDGLTIGGFFELALGCDIILVSESAEFVLNEVNLGLIPGYGGINRLLNIVGKNRAFEIISTGRTIGANEAINLGIATKLFNDNNFNKCVKQYCSELALKPCNALRLIKNTLQKITSTSDIDSIEIENFIKAVNLNETQQQIQAFLNKNL